MFSLDDMLRRKKAGRTRLLGDDKLPPRVHEERKGDLLLPTPLPFASVCLLMRLANDEAKAPAAEEEENGRAATTRERPFINEQESVDTTIKPIVVLGKK